MDTWLTRTHRRRPKLAFHKAKEPVMLSLLPVGPKSGGTCVCSSAMRAVLFSLLIVESACCRMQRHCDTPNRCIHHASRVHEIRFFVCND